MTDRVAYDEFAYFADNAAEFGIPYDGPPAVRRDSVDVGDGRRLSALVWGDEPPEYVLNQVLETLLARDREFVAWREGNPGPHTPRATTAKGRPRRRHDVHANRLLADSGQAGARGAASSAN